MLKHGILGLLNYGSMTGYDITLTFKNSLNYFWTAQTSQIYRELQTLYNNGWTVYETVEQTGKPDKKLFSITESGRAELRRWLTDDKTEFGTRSPLLIKTFFRGELSIDENIEYFDKLKESCDKFIETMKTSQANIDLYSGIVNDPTKALYWKMTMEYGLMFEQMYKSWIDKCREELEAFKNEHTDN